MFKDKEGNLSTTKIMSFVGFFAFLGISVYVLAVIPEKFNYNLFAILTGGGAVGSRVIDKWLNIEASKKERVFVCDYNEVVNKGHGVRSDIDGNNSL